MRVAGPGPLVNPPASHLGREPVILWGKGRRHWVAEFPGPLSVKTVVRGEAHWRTGEGSYRLDRHSYLVLNESREYTIEVDSCDPVETFCVFFPNGYLPERFFESLRASRDSVASVMRELHAAVSSGRGGRGWREDGFQRLAEALTGERRLIEQIRSRIHARKVSTREDLFRRLEQVRHWIEASLAEPLDLTAVARPAGMAPFHFHRTFREVYRETPHQYITRRRLEWAARLLDESDWPVTAVCLETGYRSPGSFSTLFHRRFGMPPREYRRIRKSREVFAIGACHDGTHETLSDQCCDVGGVEPRRIGGLLS